MERKKLTMKIRPHQTNLMIRLRLTILIQIRNRIKIRIKTRIRKKIPIKIKTRIKTRSKLFQYRLFLHWKKQAVQII